MSSKPASLETDNWSEIYNSSNVDEFDDFINAVNKSFEDSEMSKGPYATPGKAYLLQSKINALEPNESITLTPGLYKLNAPLLLTRPIRLIGKGRVVVEFDPKGSAIVVASWSGAVPSLRFTHQQTVIENICFRPKEWSVSSDLTKPVISLHIGSNRTQINDCSFTARRNNVIKTAANQTSVSRCVFHGGTVSGGSDIYYEDTASRGIVFGNLWSTTRSFVLSYKSGTDMSQAANGPSSIIESRP